MQFKSKNRPGVLATGIFMCFFAASSTGVAADLREDKSTIREVDGIYRASAEQDGLAADADLDAILHYALLSNPELEAAFYLWKASFHEIKQARSLEDPEFSFKWYIHEVETRVGPMQEVYGVSQKIPFPGKLRTQGQMQTAESRKHYAVYEKTKLKLIYEVKKAFYEYWYLYKAIQVTEENKKLIDHIQNVAQSKYKSNQTSNQDLLKAQVELGKLANELLTLHDYQKPLVANLNRLLNRTPEAELAWPAKIEYDPRPFDAGRARAVLKENNPDLGGATQEIEKTGKEVRLSKLDYFPDVMVGWEYGRVDPRPVSVSGNGDDDMAVMFKVNLPLWYGKQKSQLEEAHARKRAAVKRKESVENDLAARFEMVYFRLKDSERQVKLYKDALVPKAEQALRAAETGYTGGQVDFLNLLDAERILLNFQLSYYRALADYAVHFAEIEMLVGSNLRGE